MPGSLCGRCCRRSRLRAAVPCLAGRTSCCPALHAGARASACTEQPQPSWFGYLSCCNFPDLSNGCKRCSTDGASCLECWPYWGLDAGTGTCKLVRATHAQWALAVQAPAHCRKLTVPSPALLGRTPATPQCPDHCLDCDGATLKCTACKSDPGGGKPRELIDGACVLCKDKRCVECRDAAICTKCREDAMFINGTCDVVRRLAGCQQKALHGTSQWVPACT